MFLGNFKLKFLLAAAFLIATFFSFYKITESPRVWMDEGIITQVSRNIANYGRGIIQIAPNDFISAGFVTTSYVVTYPIGLMFKLFGVGVLQARLVMIFFILFFLMGFYFLIKNRRGEALAYYSLFLLVSFAPIYGNGKNVLGEIPGLLFLGLFLFFLDKLVAYRKVKDIVLAGFFLGLSIITKPIFIVLIPAVLIALIFFRREAGDIFLKSKKNLIYFIAPSLFVGLIWFLTQFSGDSIGFIWSFYSNPYAANLKEVITLNLYRFLREAQPIYFIGLMCLWSISFFVRRKKIEDMSPSEAIAFIFSWLIFLAYLRTPGYYRYFFPGEILSLVYLPSSLFFIFEKSKFRNLLYVFLILLIFFQFYQTIFNSWVSNYYNSKSTFNLNNYFKMIDKNEEILIYQAPEILLFLPHNNYYQYIEVTDKVHVGEKNLPLLTSGLIKKVIIPNSFLEIFNESFNHYKIHDNIDRYVVLKAE